MNDLPRAFVRVLVSAGVVTGDEAVSWARSVQSDEGWSRAAYAGAAVIAGTAATVTDPLLAPLPDAATDGPLAYLSELADDESKGLALPMEALPPEVAQAVVCRRSAVMTLTDVSAVLRTGWSVPQCLALWDRPLTTSAIAIIHDHLAHRVQERRDPGSPLPIEWFELALAARAQVDSACWATAVQRASAVDLTLTLAVLGEPDPAVCAALDFGQSPTAIGRIVHLLGPDHDAGAFAAFYSGVRGAVSAICAGTLGASMARRLGARLAGMGPQAGRLAAHLAPDWAGTGTELETTVRAALA